MSDLIDLSTIWNAVRCPECQTIAGLACEDEDGYRHPEAMHLERMRLFLASQPIARCDRSDCDGTCRYAVLQMRSHIREIC